jgi:hypothetical protein
MAHASQEKFDLIGSDGIGALNAEVAKLDQQDASAEIQKTPEEQAVEDQYKQDVAKASAVAMLLILLNLQIMMP